jgi:GAF domain-containing protein/anti-sigma regulatory factor (Ser/Thr protein kinase)
VRLFNETKEALEQQTATAEILRVLSGSPTDTQPVFDAILQKATALCDADTGALLSYDGAAYHALALRIPDPAFAVVMAKPRQPGSMTGLGRLARERRAVHIPNLLDDDAYRNREPTRMEAVEIGGMRTWVGVPMLKDGEVVGAIMAYRKEVRPFDERQIALLQTFADQAVIAIENVRLFNETKEALERQTATAEILKVISSSPTDVQPVFDAIVAHAGRIAGGCSVNVSRLVGDQFHLAAYTRISPEADDALERAYPFSLGEVPPLAEAVRRKAPFFVGDWETDPDVSRKSRDVMRARGYRSTLYVPIVRGDRVYGVMHVSKLEPGPFPDQWVNMLRIFADQAVIAIENVRLFNETKEALDQQKASAEVLQVISSSVADTKPVFDKILESCERLFAGLYVGINVVGEDGLVHLAEFHGRNREEFEKLFPTTVTMESGTGAAILLRQVMHYPDTLRGEGVPDFVRRACQVNGARAVIVAPMLWEDRGIGAIYVARDVVGPFAETEIALLKTFADQAVIAIQNTRLFNETKEALEQQTATAEILKVISASPTDVQPVFDAIATSGVRLFQGVAVSVRLVKGDQIERVAFAAAPGCEVTEDSINTSFALDDRSFAGRVVLRGEVVHVADVRAADWIGEMSRTAAERMGVRAIAAAPMLREGRALGSIGVTRARPGPFSDKELALLRTFADQAVIAIQNARLFNETKEALERQTATAEILRVISVSPTDVQPVFDAIVKSGVHLFRGVAVTLRLVKGDRIERAAFAASPDCEVTDDLAKPPFPLDERSITGRAVLRRELVHVADVFAEEWVGELSRQIAERMGWRAVACAPLLREGDALGAIMVTRARPAPFGDKEIALLRTFADQAVIAIENVRLFNETKEALDHQRASAEVLQVISSSVADAKPVFEKILESCERLFVGKTVGVSLVGEDGAIHLSAYHGPNREEMMRNFPVPLNESSGAGTAILQRRVVQYPDTEVEGVPDSVRRGTRIRGDRSAFHAPMLWEGRGIGSIFVSRPSVGAFSEKEIALLKTFADQAVIAIQNARLFNETKEALDHQKASAEILQVISSSVADAKPVFEKILESCERLFVGKTVGVSLVGEDGLIHVVAYHGPHAQGFSVPLTEASASGSAILQRRVMHYPDVEAPGVPDYARRGSTARGDKALLVAPMLWEGRGIGVVFVGRSTVGEFSEKEIALLKTFADQAVIAIQNAKLFHEIQEKSHQLEIANQHKSTFLANMSHELRTPLNAVIGFSEMLNARYFGDLTAKQAEYVNDIHGSGKHLLSLINDILDLSKIEAGRMELEVSEFDLRAALDNALTLVRERAQRGGVALRLDADPALGLFEGDERKLKQVVLNLLSNAVKFTPRGGAVNVAAKRIDGAAEIAVSDTGVGIAPADQEAIFEAFRQVGTDVTRKREGTGLGLALARRFVELHGGTIRVESAPGKGSTFTVTLPLRHGE